MPMLIETIAGGENYASPFVGPVDHTLQHKVDISTLTDKEVDANGYLKPGVPLSADGSLCGASSGSDNYVFGVTVEAVKLPITLPRTNTTLGNETGDCFVAVATHGIVNRDIGEDILGRAYTSDEVLAFSAAGSHIRLTAT